MISEVQFKMNGILIDKLKTIIYLTGNFIYRIIYLFMMSFPVKNNRIFVNVYDGRGIGDHPKYIIQELLKINPDIEVIWFSEREETDMPIIFSKPYSLKSLYYMATSKVWISTVRMPLYTLKRSKQYYVQTWHGSIPLKHIENDCADSLSERYIMQAKHDSKMIDIFISNSSFRTNNFKTAFWYGGEVLEIGSPRDDIFYNPKSRVELKAKFNVIGKNVVLHAPTFREKTSTGVLDLDYITLKKTLTQKFGGEWIVMVRLHPKIAQKAVKINFGRDVFDMSAIKDPQEVLGMADIVITDYSGLMFDALTVHTPVFLYANDITAYCQDRGFYFDLSELPFPVATDNKELNDRIDDFNYIEYNSEADLFLEKLGIVINKHSSEDVARLINNKLNNNR